MRALWLVVLAGACDEQPAQQVPVNTQLAGVPDTGVDPGTGDSAGAIGETAWRPDTSLPDTVAWQTGVNWDTIRWGTGESGIVGETGRDSTGIWATADTFVGGWDTLDSFSGGRATGDSFTAWATADTFTAWATADTFTGGDTVNDGTTGDTYLWSRDSTPNESETFLGPWDTNRESGFVGGDTFDETGGGNWETGGDSNPYGSTADSGRPDTGGWETYWNWESGDSKDGDSRFGSSWWVDSRDSYDSDYDSDPVPGETDTDPDTDAVDTDTDALVETDTDALVETDTDALVETDTDGAGAETDTDGAGSETDTDLPADTGSETDEPGETDEPAETDTPGETDEPGETDPPVETDPPIDTDTLEDTDPPEDKPGCNCDSAGGLGWMWLVAPLMIARRRRSGAD